MKRNCLDSRDLNMTIKGGVSHLQTNKEIVTRLAWGDHFNKLEASRCCLLMPLILPSQKLTIFYMVFDVNALYDAFGIKSVPVIP